MEDLGLRWICSSGLVGDEQTIETVVDVALPYMTSWFDLLHKSDEFPSSSSMDDSAMDENVRKRLKRYFDLSFNST